jgi:soluble lytic murein transglycosylase-like protein
MRNRIQFCLLVAACGLVWSSLLSRAARADEIVAVTDQRGRVIFINTGDTGTSGGWATRPVRPAKAGSVFVPRPEINHLVEETASRFQVDPQLVHAIIKVESQYDPNAVSRKGAMGLMQLIPETAQRFRVVNPFDPKENIEGGVSYLKYLLDLYGGDLSLSLAAYNAGEHAVERFGGIPSFSETRDYVHKVTNLYQSGSPQSGTYAADKKPQASPITRYVDEQGVVHYSNVE